MEVLAAAWCAVLWFHPTPTRQNARRQLLNSEGYRALCFQWWFHSAAYYRHGFCLLYIHWASPSLGQGACEWDAQE
jgi:hypothetical protein